MNYRALEDLVGILVKKAGFKLSDLKVEEDIDFLEERKKYLEGEIGTLKSKLSSFEYLNKDEKQKDEEEKKYFEETLSTLNNSLSELESKLSDKNTKQSTKRKIEGEKVLLVNEISNVTEGLELANLKLSNKEYFDFSAKTKDETNLEVLENELREVNEALEVKYNNPVILGNKLLEAFKDNKPFDSVSSIFDILLSEAKTEYDKTNVEVKDSNIFELMDRYTNKKRESSSLLENNDYNSEDIKQDLFEKEKYHNSRLDSFRNTLDSIDKRREELRVLMDESKKLYDGVHKEIVSKEDRLQELINTLYNETNLVIEEEDYKKCVNDLRNEIVDDKFLENKYNKDIQSFKEEFKNLDINYSNISNEINSEERSLEIIHEKLNNKNNDLISKLQDKVDFLVYSNRVDSLVNEQQYLYVNVDVIRDEIISMWSKGDDASSHKKNKTTEVKEEEVIVNEPIEENTLISEENVVLEENQDLASMYDEELPTEENEQIEVIDYLE